MATEPVTSLDLHPRIHNAVVKAKLNNIKSVLLLSAGDLARRTGLSHSDVDGLIAAASFAVVHHSSISPTTALKLHTEKKYSPNHGRLSTGCVSIDTVLRGGLVIPGINEIAGVSAAGKTQLCLQLCLTVQLPQELGGLNGSAVYISTEDAFPSKRWQQLSTFFASKYSHLGLTVDKLSNNLYIEHAATVSTLSRQLQYKLPSLLSQHPVKLVVIDSVAALFRVEFGAHQAIERAQVLREFGHRLKLLSERHHTAVVCVNQVTAAMDGPDSPAIKPALGLTWADVVTTRIMLTRPEGVDAAEDYQEVSKLVPRKLQVLFAPHLPQASLQYYIHTDGIHSDGIHTDGIHTDGIHSDGIHTDGIHSDGDVCSGAVNA